MKWIQGTSFPGSMAVQENFMEEAVFEMSLELYVEEVGMEMEGHLRQKPHLFGSPVQASPGRHIGLCVDQTTAEEQVV